MTSMTHSPTRESDYLVSAIVSVYDADRFMAGCLDDLTNQSLGERLEIIVIDACSPGNEADVVREYQKRHPNIVYVRTPEREGIYASWNRGARMARGRYLTNANTDDRHRPDALERMVRELDEHPGADAVYGDCYLSTRENESWDENAKLFRYRFPEFFPPSVLLFCQLGPQPMWRKSLHERIGYFDESYKAAGDYDFNLRLGLEGRARHIPEPLGLYLKHDQAITFRDETMGRENERLRVAARSPERVEAAYAGAGFPLDTDQDRARAHLDMGLRAMEFFTPWGMGLPEADTGFAVECFRRARALAPQWGAAANNLAVGLARCGDFEVAAEVLSGAPAGGSVSEREQRALLANARLLERALDRPALTMAMHLLPSGLEAPTQLELALGRELPGEQGVRPPLAEADDKKNYVSSFNTTSKRKVLLVGEFFWPSIGGIEVFLEELGSALAGAGYAVEVATKPWEGRGATTHRGMAIHEFHLWERPDLEDVCAFRQLVREGDYASVIVIGHPAGWVSQVFHHLTALGQTSLYLPSINKENVEHLEQGGQMAQLAWLLQQPTHLVRVTESGYDARVLEALKLPSHFVPHAVSPSPAKKRFHDMYGLNPELPLLVMVGNYWPVKNHLGLLDTLRPMAEPFQLVLIGNPHNKPYYDAVVRRAAADKRVRVLGLVPREVAAAAIRDADLVLLPSKGESAGPFVIMEAMALGTPWIATPECNMVRDEAGGVVVPLERFPQAIRSLLANPGLAAALSTLGRRHWQSRFTWEQSLTAFVSLIESRADGLGDGRGEVPDLSMPAELRAANANVQRKVLAASPRPN